MSPRARDLRDGEVPLRRLGLRGARGGVVGIDLRGRGGAQGPSAVGHRVVDVAVDEIVDVGVVQGVADEGVGHAVLHGAQVHMRQRRLGHRGDDARHPRQLVGQRLIDHDVARIGAVLQRHDPQEAVSLRLVQRDEVHVGEDVLLQQHPDAGLVVEGPLLVIALQRRPRNRVVHEVALKQRHARRQDLMRIRHRIERVIALRLELEAVHTQRTIRSHHIRVVDDHGVHTNAITTQKGQVLLNPRFDDVPERMVRPVCLGVLVIDDRAVGGHAEQGDLDVLQVDEMRFGPRIRAVVGQRLERLAVGNGHRAVDEPDSLSGVQRIHRPQFCELGDVVDAVPIHVARLSHQILLHTVAVCGEGPELLGQRGRAGLAQRHRHRYLNRGPAVQVVQHVEHVVLLDGGLDHNGNGLDLDQRRRGA